MNKLLLCAFVLGTSLWVNAQQVNNQPTVSLENIQKISEVYGSNFVEQNPTLVVFFDRLLNERISYRLETFSDEEKYPLLSSFGLNNKVNANVQPVDPASFTPEGFNPLSYGVGFTQKHTLVIRIDGTEYVMIVQPQ